MRYFIIIFFIATLAGCNVTKGRKLTFVETKQVEYKLIEYSRLVSNLTTYDGQYIETNGIFYSAPEQNILYSTADTGFSKKGLWIAFDERLSFKNFFTKKENINPFVKRFAARIRGKVDAKNHGHMGSFPGSIVDITYLEKL